MFQREIKRKPNRGVSDKSEIYAILDEGFVAHVGFNDPDTQEPTVIPVAYGRDGDRILFHGSTGSRMFMALKAGVPMCATVTLFDGIISARSPFNSSMNYRSVMVFGIGRVLEGDEKKKGLYAVSERLVPGLWDAGRELTAKEYAQTMMVELKLDDVTAKKRTGGANDPEDSSLPIWAGLIPVELKFGEPISNEDSQHIEVPDYIKNFAKNRKVK